MGKNINKIIVIIMATIFIISMGVTGVLAVDEKQHSSNAREAIDVTKKGSLEITYKAGEDTFSGMEINIYHFADVTKDFDYNLIGDFADCAVALNDVETSDDWQDVTGVIEGYINDNKIAPTYTATTDAYGKVKFDDIPLGLYFTAWAKNQIDDNTLAGFDASIIQVPLLADDDSGKWNYDVKAVPKSGTYTYRDTIYTVSKLWVGDNDEVRPEEITIKIFKNGEVVETVKLTSVNSWKHSWKAPADGARWSVAEVKVKDYTGAQKTIVKGDDVTINLVNKYNDIPPFTPGTGDTGYSAIKIWGSIALVSGFVLMVTAIIPLFRRKREEA